MQAVWENEKIRFRDLPRSEVPRLCGAPGLLTLIVLQAALSGAFRDTTAVLRLVLQGAGLNAVLTPLGVATLHGGTAGCPLACFVA